jgi:flagellar protein FlbB
MFMAGRIFILLLLVAILAAGGIVWFDYLNIIDAKSVLSPLSRFIGRQPRSQPETTPDQILDLDAERLAVRPEALDLQRLEMDTRNRDMDLREGRIEQMAQELEERQKALEEQAKSLSILGTDAENRDRRIEENARILNGMPPERAVGIMSAMDDQDVIDVLRKTEEIAQAAGTSSMVSYWMSLMDPVRAAELQRKMAGRPQTL